MYTVKSENHTISILLITIKSSIFLELMIVYIRNNSHNNQNQYKLNNYILFL